MLMLRVQMREFLQLREFICRSSRQRFGAFLPTAHFLCKRRFRTLFGAEDPGRPDRRNRTCQLSGPAWKIATGRTEPASPDSVALNGKGAETDDAPHTSACAPHHPFPPIELSDTRYPGNRLLTQRPTSGWEGYSYEVHSPDQGSVSRSVSEPADAYP
jgi:hypothetical protein